MFFTINLILSFLSTQLYQVGSESNEILGDDLFLNYLYISIEKRLRVAMNHADGDISNTIPAVFIKSLILNVIECLPPPSDSILLSLSSNSQFDTDSSQHLSGNSRSNALNYQSSNTMPASGGGNVAVAVREVLMAGIGEID